MAGGIFVTYGTAQTILSNGVDVPSSISNFFVINADAPIILTASKTGVFTQLVFSIFASYNGTSYNQVGTWDAVASGTMTLMLSGGCQYYISATSFAGGTSVSVTAALAYASTTAPPLSAGTNVIGHVVTDTTSVTAATLNAETTKVIGTINIAAAQTIAVTNTGTFAVQSAATLNAETTKVIGVVRNADGAGNLFTSNSTTPAAHFAQDANITSILGTAPTTVGKLDVKGADGDVFVRQATAANLNATVSIAAAQTLATVTTVSTVSAARVVGNAGATMDAAIGGAAPTNAQWHTNAPATASAAATTVKFINASGAAVNVKASAGNLYGFSITNETAAVAYIEFFNTAGTPTLGTTAVVFAIKLPASANITLSPGALALMNFATGIGFAVTTTENGSTTASVTGMLFYL